MHTIFKQKNIYHFAHPYPKSIQTPKCYVSLKSFYNFLKIYISEFWIWSLGLMNSPWKKIAKKFTNNFRGKTCLYPQNPPGLSPKWEQSYFSRSSFNYEGNVGIIYPNWPRGVWELIFGKNYIGGKLAEISHNKRVTDILTYITAIYIRFIATCFNQNFT